MKARPGFVGQRVMIDSPNRPVKFLDPYGLPAHLMPVVVYVKLTGIPEALTEVDSKVVAALNRLQDSVKLLLGLGILQSLLHAADSRSESGRILKAETRWLRPCHVGREDWHRAAIGWHLTRHCIVRVWSIHVNP
jgi:hypothetical protein